MTHVYFDHNATTPLNPSVLEAMLPYLRDEFGNASSRHSIGARARRAVERAREQVAAIVGAQASQVVFVSGGTEANNLFIKGAADCLKPAQIVVSPLEHPCVAAPARELARRGWKLRKLRADNAGLIAADDLEHALAQATGIVSVMLANNETGVLQDIAQIAEAARACGAWMHTDAVQALGKVPVDFGALGVHALTVSAHKIYGPKGAGALVLDKRIELKPLLSGGGHERGFRSGTENVPAVVGFGAACELAQTRPANLSAHFRLLRDRLEQGVRTYGGVIFGDAAPRIPNTSYFGFSGIDGDALVIELDRLGYAVASGAACSSLKDGPSDTLLAMGVAPELARTAVRVSVGRDNTEAQVSELLAALKAALERLERLAAIAVQA